MTNTPVKTSNPETPQAQFQPVAEGANPNPDYYRLGDNGEKIEITRAEYKKYQRQNTTVKHQRVPMCGHKFVQGKEPRHKNCETCWFSFFQVYGELTQSVEEVYAKKGPALIVQLKGKKFLVNFLKFMATVAVWKMTADAAKEKQDGSTSTVEGSNGEDNAVSPTEAPEYVSNDNL